MAARQSVVIEGVDEYSLNTIPSMITSLLDDVRK